MHFQKVLLIYEYIFIILDATVFSTEYSVLRKAFVKMLTAGYPVHILSAMRNKFTAKFMVNVR